MIDERAGTTADGRRTTVDGRANPRAVVVRRWSVVERRKNNHHKGTEGTEKGELKGRQKESAARVWTFRNFRTGGHGGNKGHEEGREWKQR
jgi:hypothetical protein